MKSVITKFENETIKRNELSKKEWEELLEAFRLKDSDSINLSSNVGLIAFSSGRFLEILPKIYRGNREEEVEEGRRLLTFLFIELLNFNKFSNIGIKGVPNFSIPFIELITLYTFYYIEKKIVQPGVYKSYIRKEVITKNLYRILLELSEFALKKFKFKKLRNLASKVALYLKDIGVEKETRLKESLSALKLNRMNQHYAPAIELSKLLLLSGKGTSGKGGATSILLYPMENLFEKFIASILPNAEIQKTFSVGKSFVLKPDILIKNTVLDTKWKVLNDYSRSRDDRFQVITYIYLLEKKFGKKVEKGILIYPEVEGEELSWDLGGR